MRAIFILLVVICIPVFGLGQKTKSKKVYYDQSKQVKETYSVLKKNKYSKHGNYKSFHKNGNLESQGQFQFNKKEGKWIEFDSSRTIKRKSVFKKGRLISDEKFGIWEQILENGMVITRYDHDKNIKLRPIINIPVRYPPKARKNQTEGVVKIAWEIDEKCDIINLRVVQSLSKACDKEALKTIRLLSQFTKKYDIEYCQTGKRVHPFTFKLE
ncbi:MAG: TonB family protein [Bacteroidota bacterium]